MGYRFESCPRSQKPEKLILRLLSGKQARSVKQRERPQSHLLYVLQRANAMRAISRTIRMIVIIHCLRCFASERCSRSSARRLNLSSSCASFLLCLICFSCGGCRQPSCEPDCLRIMVYSGGWRQPPQLKQIRQSKKE